ncbi:LPXTG cell wall anchor domain-containing protein [[Ruminococcus] gnavus]|uniref:LPXTG cell wall anchor domain-containing protein n=1 Tax=Mediterraneibacter gnavus TaxID=33038 RepID=UPI0022858A52|nr:LPXTG cell wall anchor domain-containing protein [Mediterraneibacter gnavus]MCZ0647923.1 LPXTG cell wall anchor domain-containing protein [Mediterraneibacter gnavus]
MKKKFVVALVAAMSLTVAGTGTVFAMNNFHIHGENCEWVVDKAAYDEVVKHPEEGHYEKVEVSPEEGHFETVHHEAEYKTVHHPAEYKTVHHPAEYDTIHHPAEYDTIHHPEEGHMEIEMHLTCNGCGQNFGVVSPDSQALWEAHMKEMVGNGDYSHMGYGTEQREVWIVDKEAWDEQVLIKDAWDEQVLVKDAWDEQVLVKEAWDEQVLIKDAYDEEVWVVDKEAVYEDKWIVDKEAWEETVHHKEEGHWVCNGEPQEPEQKPENPDVETPETPDAENPATPEQKPEVPTTPEENKENVQTQATETKKEGTSPKTGDTTSALPVAGAGLASLGVALATILKKRK